MEPASEADYQAMESQQASNNGAVQQASNNKYFTAFVNWSSVTMVDAFIAAGGLIFAGVVLRTIDLTMGKGALPLFNGAMLTMAIVFFANPAPPPYKVFLQCTIGAWSLGFLLKYMMLESMIVTIIVAGMLLIFFKWAKVMFPPTLGVAVFLISDQTLMPPVNDGAGKFAMYALHWLVTPWLAGSIWFYLIAKLTSKLRARVKTQLSLLKFAAAFADKTDAELIQAFKGERRPQWAPTLLPSAESRVSRPPRLASPPHAEPTPAVVLSRSLTCRDRRRWRRRARQQGARPGLAEGHGRGAHSRAGAGAHQRGSRPTLHSWLAKLGGGAHRSENGPGGGAEKNFPRRVNLFPAPGFVICGLPFGWPCMPLFPRGLPGLSTEPRCLPPLRPLSLPFSLRPLPCRHRWTKTRTARSTRPSSSR